MKAILQKLRELPVIGVVLRHRFAKFGSVGASGTVVNLSVLFLGQEYLFAGIQDSSMRLNVALAFAILVATLNNFTWNRLWTWRDRKRQLSKGLLTQVLQYFAASWLAILVQVVVTKLLVSQLALYYLFANVIAIVLAAVVNYLVNDAWTFGMRKRPQGTSTPCPGADL